MLESEKLAIAAHLHVVLRRKLGRVTDVEWLLKSPEYAREVIRLSQRETAHPELVDWANRLQQALFPAPRSPVLTPSPASGFQDSRLEPVLRAAPVPRYVGSLR
jgi:hypothetical protein